MKNLTVGEGGEIALPQDLRDRYGFLSATPVRVIETRSGILLVPLTGAPMSAELTQEVSEWQSLSAGSWGLFPYEGEGS